MHPNPLQSRQDQVRSGDTVVHILTLVLAFLMVIATECLHAQQVVKHTFSGASMLVYTPPSYASANNAHPLLIFLHDESEIGNDPMTLTKTSNQYPCKLIAQNKWNISLPFVVITPQLKVNSQIPGQHNIWGPSHVNEIVEFARKNYRIDSYRIYVTGVGLGATGAWNYAAAYPTKVAALVPISGKPELKNAHAVRNIPIWAFHGEMDAIVPATQNVEMINAIKTCVPSGHYIPRLTLLPTRGRDICSDIYNGKNGMDIYQWFLRFSKNVITNQVPYVNANEDQIISLTGAHHLCGDFFDWDGAIKSISWTQISGSPISLSGTNGAFLKLSQLKPGDYEFQLTVRDDDGAVAHDRVKLRITNAHTVPSIHGLVLMNGKTNTDIASVNDAFVVNKTSLASTEFNLRVIPGPGVQSVRFQINGDRSTRIVNYPGPFLIKKQTSTPEWTMSNGTYVVCATPYSQPGATGNAGPTFCRRIFVTSSIDAPSIANVSPGNDPVTIKSIDDILVSNVSVKNQWVLNGEDIKGATGPIYRPMLPGEYFVRIIDRTSLDVSNSVSVLQKENKITKAGLQVIANPAQTYLQIRGEMVPDRAMYKIIKKGGIMVQEGAIDSQHRIAFAETLEKGNYTLLITTKQGNQSARFQIQ